METSTLVTLIGAILSFVGVIALGLFQRKLWKSQAKKTDVESYTTLVETITKRTDTEFTIMKELNTKLREQVNSLQVEKDILVKEVADLRRRLEDCEDCLTRGKDG